MDRKITPGKDWEAMLAGNPEPPYDYFVYAPSYGAMGYHTEQFWTLTKEDAEFHALAHNTANELYDMGYDAEVVLRMLPELILDAQRVVDDVDHAPLPDKHFDTTTDIRTLGNALNILTSKAAE